MNSDKKKKLLTALWEVFKSFLLSTVRDAIVKNTTKFILKAVGKTSVYTWLATFIAENFYEELMEPLLKAGLVEAEYTYHKKEGKILIEKLKGATNAEEYNSTVDDILS